MHLKGKVSVIVPVRDEEESIMAFVKRIRAVLESIQLDWEVIFVEDSSKDNTVELLYEVCKKDKRFCAIFLTRSFGHHEALTAGIDHAGGDHFIMMDGDLQHPPEVISDLLKAYDEGYDMVYAKRSTREGIMKQLGSNVINKVMNWLSDSPIDLSSSMFRIFSKRVRDTLGTMRERRRFITGMLSWPGFKTKEIHFEEAARARGESKYSLNKMVILGFNAITSFTIKPLRLAMYVGFISSSMSVLFGVYYVGKFLLVGIPVPGFASIIAVMFFLGGLILFVLGIIGEYIGNVFVEAKGRPLYVVSKTLNIGKERKEGHEI